MGPRPKGRALTWQEIEPIAEDIRRHGIKQFINTFKKNKDRTDSTFKWGDEIEYIMAKIDHNNKKVRLSIKSEQILDILNEIEAKDENHFSHWTPEVCRFTVEGIPGQPFIDSDPMKNPLDYIKEVEPNMRARRREAKEILDQDEELFTLTIYPRLGTEDCTHPYTAPDSLKSETRSELLSDEVLYLAHPRYVGTIHSVINRRGRKVALNVPIFKDIKTMDPFIEKFRDEESNYSAKPDHIYIDSPAQGWGSCCLQMTMQTFDLNEAMHLYDQLAPITPIALALSAAAPIQRGYLTDRDCRWFLLSATMDDRTKEELGEVPLSGGFRVPKSRYDSLDSYLSDPNDKYNDIPFRYNGDYYKQLVSEGVPKTLAKHVSHLFLRDPMVVIDEALQQDDEKDTGNFDDIWSINWQTLRFKPPPSDPSIGWRVEFRPMDIQLTDFENAAYVVFIILLSRVILSFKLNLLIPISKIDENMIEAQKRDAINRNKFWFRKDIFTDETPEEVKQSFVTNNRLTISKCKNGTKPIDDESCLLMTINEIINGKDSQFPGLVPLIRTYVNNLQTDVETRETIDSYLELISGRATGRLRTCAKWIRDFVRQHNQYNCDSVVNDLVNYDLLCNVQRLQNVNNHDLISNYQ